MNGLATILCAVLIKGEDLAWAKVEIPWKRVLDTRITSHWDTAGLCFFFFFFFLIRFVAKVCGDYLPPSLLVGIFFSGLNLW